MKLLFLIIIPLLSFAQNNNTEYYKSGVLKYELIPTKSGNIIKEYYKNGQLKYSQNEPEKTTETYYKNGVLSYRKTYQKNFHKEEFYDREGLLTIQVINDIITFSAYEHSTEEEKNRNNHHEHKHNHNHGHGHDHHH